MIFFSLKRAYFCQIPQFIQRVIHYKKFRDISRITKWKNYLTIKFIHLCKGVMQVKLIAVVYTVYSAYTLKPFDIRLVFTLPPRDSTLQYKRCVHFWNNFPCTCVSFGVVQKPVTLSTGKFKWRKRNQKLKLNHVQPLNLVITLLDCQKIFNGKNYDNKKNNFKGVTDSVW